MSDYIIMDRKRYLKVRAMNRAAGRKLSGFITNEPQESGFKHTIDPRVVAHCASHAYRLQMRNSR